MSKVIRGSRKLVIPVRKKRATVKANLRRIRRLEGEAEYSQHWNNISAQSPGTTGIITVLTDMPQGDDIGNRQGNDVNMKSVECRWTVVPDASTTSDLVRLVVFRYNTQNGVDPVATDLFNTDAVQSLPKRERKKDFKIMFDKTIGFSSTDKTPVVIKFFKSVNHKVHYIGSGTTAASRGKNQYFSYMVALDNTNQAEIDLHNYITFTE